MPQLVLYVNKILWNELLLAKLNCLLCVTQFILPLNEGLFVAEFINNFQIDALTTLSDDDTLTHTFSWFLYNQGLSYSTVVLYIGIMKVLGFLPKIPPTNQPNIYFLTVGQYWLGITKPKNVFRSTLNLCIKLLCNFKNFLFNRFFY